MQEGFGGAAKHSRGFSMRAHPASLQEFKALIHKNRVLSVTGKPKLGRVEVLFEARKARQGVSIARLEGRA